MNLPVGQVVLTSVIAYALAVHYLGRAYLLSRYMTMSFLVIAAYGIVAELLEIRSAHSYYYTELLVMFGERPGWVPLTIGCSWASLIFVSMRTSDLLRLPWWQRPFLDGAVAVSMDLVIDPVSSNSRWVQALGDSCVGAGQAFGGIGVWTWCVPHGDKALWFNVPLDNFFLWFAIVVTISMAVRVGQHVFGGEGRGRWAQLGLLIALAAVAMAVLFAVMEGYTSFMTGVTAQRVAIAAVVLGPLVLVLLQARRLRFDNHLELGLLVAPAWMFLSGTIAFGKLGIAGRDGPGSTALLVAAALFSSLILLAPYLATLVDRKARRRARQATRKPPPRIEVPTGGGPAKVAILGGGVGAITTAFELTQPELRGKYDVTVYQLGWRLGGKGASGRNPDAGARIEEHGIHFWSGVYDNAFHAIRTAYEELDRPPGAPLATWWDAFKPAEAPMSLMEHFQGTWKPWTIESVRNPERPGSPGKHLLLPMWVYVSEALQVLRGWFDESRRAARLHHRRPPGFWARLLRNVEHYLTMLFVDVGGHVLDAVFAVLGFFYRFVGPLMPRGVKQLFHALIHFFLLMVVEVSRLFVTMHWWHVRKHLDDVEIREAWAPVNLGLGLLRGVLREEVVTKGFQTIAHLDFREWLRPHIVWDAVEDSSPYEPGGRDAERSLALNSPFAMLLYNSDFAFEDGETTKPRLDAGVVAYTLLRLALTTKGTLLWQMEAGMGDTIFTPLYQVLERRGVKFEFFRKVKGLHVSEDGESIGSVTIARQAELAAGRDRYDPLVDVKGLACWPSVPHWEQLRDGERYRSEGVNFEDWYGPEIDEMEIRAGQDYDVLILGISLGAHPYVCSELMEARPAWKAMVDNIARVRTQSAQMWFTKTAWDMGFEEERASPSVSCYDVSNFDVWFDLSHLLCREGWSEDPEKAPRSLAYINGCMQGHIPRDRTQTPEELDQKAHNARIEELGEAFLVNDVFRIYSNEAAPGRFDWGCLFDPTDRTGPARLSAQYARANVQPTELYVQSLPG
ncbi:MAG: NAD(P)-binding protein, partial [Gemmatimonadota bacterium]